jgi:hypothetical protein
LHPQRVGPGIWQATHTFKQGGNYKLWADVKFRGTSYSFGQALLSVSGDFGPPVPRKESPGSVTCSGYRIKLDQSRPWRITETNQLQFLIEDSTGKPAELDNYLGAPMHLVIVHEDLSAYLHAHPEGRRPGDAHIRFNQSLPKPGYYQLFAQFRPRAANLPPDEAILAEFRIKVPEP